MKRFAFLIPPAIIFGLFIYFATKEPSEPDPEAIKEKLRKDLIKEAKKREEAEAEIAPNEIPDSAQDLVERLPEPLPLDKKLYREYLKAQKFPHIKNLRKALNDISRGKWATKYVEEGIEYMMYFGEDKNGNPVQVDFSQFNEKILVLFNKYAPMGGYQVFFIFENNMMQFFEAWMFPYYGIESKSVLRSLTSPSLSLKDRADFLFNCSNYLVKQELFF